MVQHERRRKSGSATASGRTAERRRQGRRTEGPSSRARILAAAAGEFAAHGYAGAAVGRIARQAGVNKAMIYYHFRNKLALYRAILRDVFTSALEQVHAVAASSRLPTAKLDAFIDTVSRTAEGHPYFPPIWLRELADRGAHLDRPTLRLMSGMFQSARAILEEGVRCAEFRQVDPALTYATMMGPIVFYLASGPVRAQVARLSAGELGRIERPDLVAHLSDVLRRGLAPDQPRDGMIEVARDLCSPRPRARGRR